MNTKNTEGIFVPGGTMACTSAFMVARNWKFPHIKSKGIQHGDKPVSFCSAQAHYSAKRSSMMSGLGFDGMRTVKSGDNGAMDVKDFEFQVQKAIDEGLTPFFVQATAGTTVMGGFDDLVEMRKVCDKYRIW